MSRPLNDTFYQGWEERTEVALVDFIGPSNESFMNSVRHCDNKFSSVESPTQLKALINRLVDSAFKGDVGGARSEQTAAPISSASPPPGSICKTNFVYPATEMIPEEEEIEEG